jgi:hypothetical protein
MRARRRKERERSEPAAWTASSGHGGPRGKKKGSRPLPALWWRAAAVKALLWWSGGRRAGAVKALRWRSSAAVPMARRRCCFCCGSCCCERGRERRKEVEWRGQQARLHSPMGTVRTATAHGRRWPCTMRRARAGARRASAAGRGWSGPSAHWAASWCAALFFFFFFFFF